MKCWSWGVGASSSKRSKNASILPTSSFPTGEPIFSFQFVRFINKKRNQSHTFGTLFITHNTRESWFKGIKWSSCVIKLVEIAKLNFREYFSKIIKNQKSYLGFLTFFPFCKKNARQIEIDIFIYDQYLDSNDEERFIGFH